MCIIQFIGLIRLGFLISFKTPDSDIGINIILNLVQQVKNIDALIGHGQLYA